MRNTATTHVFPTQRLLNPPAHATSLRAALSVLAVPVLALSPLLLTACADDSEALLVSEEASGAGLSRLPSSYNGSTTFEMSGAVQDFDVPLSGVYRLSAAGAQGGLDDYGNQGGLGAEVSGEFELSAGQVLQVVVGERPALAGTGTSGGGGGGGSFVYDGTTAFPLPAQPLLAAGGGGGGNGTGGVITEDGGDGTALGGEAGQGGSAMTGWLYSGAAGAGWLSPGANGSEPLYSQGGQRWEGGVSGTYSGAWSSAGGFGGGGASGFMAGGGGAGGGYSGGGAGYQLWGFPAGGGSYNAGTNPTASAAAHAGHGTVSIVGPLCQADIPQGVGWWAAEGDASDVYGLNPGELGGTAIASGYSGDAFDFDGTHAVRVADSASLSLVNNLTLEGWIYLRAYNSTTLQTVVSKNRKSGGTGYAIQIMKTGKVALALNNNSFNLVLQSAEPIPTGQWVHVAGVRSGSLAQVFVNGVLAAQTTSAPSGDLLDSSMPLTIGSEDTIANRFFNGLVDELTVYSTALSEAQIQAIVRAKQAGKCE